MQRQIRQSQTISPFGVGAIFDIQGESFVACDIYEWGGRGVPVLSERLTTSLGVRQLKAAEPMESGPFGKGVAGVPYARFPAWLFCQKCRRMVRWTRSMEQDGKAPACPDCPGRKQLVPMRWVQVCKRGHLMDVDWRYWAHFGASQPEHKQCGANPAKLSFEALAGQGSGGLDTLLVRCRACGARRTLGGITGTETLSRMGVKCPGRQPWEHRDAAEACGESPRAVQRGASNVYFPLTHSSIEIPTASRADAQSELALDIKNSIWFQPLVKTDESSHTFGQLVRNLADEVEATDELVIAVVRDERRQMEGQGTSVPAASGDLLAGEWAAFVTPWTDLDPDGDFVTRHVDLVTGDLSTRPDHQHLDDRVSKVVIADRLREVRVLEGFHRVAPGSRDTLVRASLRRKLDWLPATEVFGEGLFIALDESRLRVWEEREDVRGRVRELAARLDGHFMVDRLRERTGPALLPRYVLLHTLGHLLIRRLAFESGYSAASLRERVYGKSAVDGRHHEPQAGVLVYTAAGDAEGTLGGLARQGEPGRLSDTLVTALEEATWCSADPLCAENHAQGFGSLNFAACHACCLVSETSCEATNSLLDRSLLVGGNGVQGFFETVVQSTLSLAAQTASAEAQS